MKVIFWIFVIYLVYRIAEYMFAQRRKSVEREKRKTTISGKDKTVSNHASRDGEDGEYIDYKEVK
jgi:hypothetical protein